MKFFWLLDPIIVGHNWSISITPIKWKMGKGEDSLGSYVRVGPIIFEYHHRGEYMKNRLTHKNIRDGSIERSKHRT